MNPKDKKLLEEEAIHIAKQGPLTRMLYLLTKEKISPNIYDNRGNSLLIHAVASKNLKMVQLLISNGAEINTNNELWITPLMTAAINKAPDIVTYLLEQGANKEETCALGKRAIDYATCQKIKELLV